MEPGVWCGRHDQQGRSGSSAAIGGWSAYWSRFDGTQIGDRVLRAFGPEDEPEFPKVRVQRSTRKPSLGSNALRLRSADRADVRGTCSARRIGAPPRRRAAAQHGLDEIQSVTISGNPTGGTFTLTLPGQTTAATGVGDLTSGSTTIANVVTSTSFPNRPVDHRDGHTYGNNDQQS